MSSGSNSEERRLEELRRSFAGLTAEQRITRAYQTFGDGLVATTSGGSTSAILMHHLKKLLPEIRIPVIFVDTGYYPPRTYEMIQRFIDDGLDVHIYSAKTSPAMQEVLFAENPSEGSILSNKLRRHIKHEPLNRAFRELGAKAWLRGVMHDQTEDRSTYPYLRYNGVIWQVHPILDWDEKRAEDYLKVHDLPRNEEHFDITKDQRAECGIGDACGVDEREQAEEEKQKTI